LTVRIAVLDPLPMFRHGLAAVLAAAGHRVEQPDDIQVWLRRNAEAVVVLTLNSERDWDVLHRLRLEAPPSRVIVLLVDDAIATGARAIQSGARSVLPRGVAARTLRWTVEATLNDQAVMPADVASALAVNATTRPTAVADPATRGALSDEQLAWLRQLARGSTVAHIADRAGYSERAMFRLLRATYEQLGVHTRIEAILRATEAGWL
jgi:DNA-binding NarL/FixJ family response regulator